MNRRTLLLSLAGFVASAYSSAAQQKMRTIGVLTGYPETSPLGAMRISAFRAGLAKLGWVEGQGFKIDYRAEDGDLEKARANASDMVRSSPDVILVNGGTSLRAIIRETKTIPLVVVNVAEQTILTYIESVSRPGGNLTGFSMYESQIGQKWLELLKEIAPHVTRVVVINSALTRPGAEPLLASAAQRQIEAVHSAANSRDELKVSIDEAARIPNTGIIVLPTTTSIVHAEYIITEAAARSIPTIYPSRYFTEKGGLVSFGTDARDLHRQAASYVDKILKGSRPGELPVQAPTKYELVINTKAAKALGLSVPATLQFRADEILD